MYLRTYLSLCLYIYIYNNIYVYPSIRSYLGASDSVHEDKTHDEEERGVCQLLPQFPVISETHTHNTSGINGHHTHFFKPDTKSTIDIINA